MRPTLALAWVSVSLAAAAACATSDDEGLQPAQNDAGVHSVPDADPASPDGAVTDGGGGALSSCTEAGWCATALPDPDLDVRDIWPLEDVAFAIAESKTLGVKVLEWSSATGSWAYIDDNSQNGYGAGQYAGKIWAPSETEIYYGVAPGRIYHGRRSTPSSPWSWSSSQLEYNGRDSGADRDPGLARYTPHHDGIPSRDPALGVWGTSPTDVYAWYANTIFHWKGVDGGAPGWAPEYIADDPENPEDTFFIFGGSASNSDDVWFTGGRARHDDTGTFACTMVTHRTPESYQRIVDHEINPADKYSKYSNTCRPKPGFAHFVLTQCIRQFGCFTQPWTNGGWVTSIASARPGGAVGLLNPNFLIYVGAEDGGTAAINMSDITGANIEFNPLLHSIWVHETSAWISGWGLVVKTENDVAGWSKGMGLMNPQQREASGMDAGPTHSTETTALNGIPLDRALYQVRGTSNTNLWAVGNHYALHKTTP